MNPRGGANSGASASRNAASPAPGSGARKSNTRTTGSQDRSSRTSSSQSSGAKDKTAGSTSSRAKSGAAHSDSAKSGTANSGSDANVSAYAVGAPLNRNFGLLHTAGARTTALLITLAMCAVIVTPVMRNYLKQYNANNAIRSEIAAQKATNDELRNDLARWDDDKYVIAQARERLTFVFPGETPYRVMGWDSSDLEETTTTSSDPALFPDQDKPWYEVLMESVTEAGDLASKGDADTADATDATTGDGGSKSGDSSESGGAAGETEPGSDSATPQDN